MTLTNRYASDRASLAKSLSELGVLLYSYESIGSTNNEAKSYASTANTTTPVLFLAREQTAGRGRAGRNFISRRGQGIYMTLLYFTKKDLCDATAVTGAAAVAAALSIEEITDKPMMIKWVNDIYNEKGKVAGILAEAVRREDDIAVAVGIGINIGESEMPEELCGIASSIGDVSGREDELVLNLVRRLLDYINFPDPLSHVPEYKKRLMLIGQEVNILRGGIICDRGSVVGVNDNLGLIIDTSRGREIMHSGEISIRKCSESKGEFR